MLTPTRKVPNHSILHRMLSDQSWQLNLLQCLHWIISKIILKYLPAKTICWPWNEKGGNVTHLKLFQAQWLLQGHKISHGDVFFVLFFSNFAAGHFPTYCFNSRKMLRSHPAKKWGAVFGYGQGEPERVQRHGARPWPNPGAAQIACLF